MRFLGAIALGAGLLGFSQAQATTVDLFNSIAGSTPSNADVVETNGPLYASFSTGGGTAVLNELQFVLIASGATGSVDVSLFSSNESTSPYPTPLALIAGLGTIPSITTDGYHTYSLTGLSQSLAANTRYWVELTATDGGFAQWAYTENTAGIGVIGEYWQANYSSGPHPNAGDDAYFAFPYEMAVRANVPLPATLPMFAGGAGLLAALIWRRKKRARA